MNSSERRSSLNKHLTSVVSIPINQPVLSTNNISSVQSLIEGSLEYRELKRQYMNEKNQADEWRKDYATLKRQLINLKSNTIRKSRERCNFEENDCFLY